MNSDFCIDKIIFSSIVKANTGSLVHTNRPSHGLAIFFGGKRTYTFEHKKFTIDGNAIVYFPKGSTYTISQETAADCYAINFQLKDDTCFEPFFMTLKNPHDYLHHFKSADKAWRHRSPSYQLLIKSELYSIIYKMQNEYRETFTAKSAGSIQPAIDFIHSHYLTESISVSDLAARCGMSEVYLRKLFQKKYGTSPNRYIKNLKLQYAAELLLSNFYSVHQICYMSGFNDESYFSREFKKHYHVSPSQFRSAYNPAIFSVSNVEKS